MKLFIIEYDDGDSFWFVKANSTGKALEKFCLKHPQLATNGRITIKLVPKEIIPQKSRIEKI